MSNDRNPDRDWPIIRARQDVKQAEEDLAKSPGPTRALALQAEQQKWKQLTKLKLVTPDGKLR